MAKGYKTGGREAGTLNKTTQDLRSRINDFLNNHWDNIEDEFMKLDSKDKLMFYEKLISYSLPKMRTLDISGEILSQEEKPQINLTDEQLKVVLNEFKPKK